LDASLEVGRCKMQDVRMKQTLVQDGTAIERSTKVKFRAIHSLTSGMEVMINTEGIKPFVNTSVFTQW